MALNHAIMTALLEDRMSGYELTKAFDTSLGFFWKASHQQIYKALRDLEQQGLLDSEVVAQAGKPDKVIYGLTDAGREALADWVVNTETRLRDAKDDLFVKLYNLSPANREHIRGEIAARVSETRQRLELYRRIQARHYADPRSLPLRQRGIYLALLAGISHCEMFLDWAHESEVVLGDGAYSAAR